MADPVRKMFFGKLATYLKEKLPDEAAAIAKCNSKPELLAIYDAHPELHPAGSAHREARSPPNTPCARVSNDRSQGGAAASPPPAAAW